MGAILHLLVFLTVSYLVHGSTVNLPTPSAKPFGLSGRIVNGTKAVLRQFPHQVSLKRSWNKNHFCGGSLITTSLVLTAGHCVTSSYNQPIQPWTIIVVGGMIKLYEETPTRQQSGVENIRIHPKFDLDNLYNDVALLTLSKPFKFTPELHSVPLSGSPSVPYTVCQVSGWGYPSENMPIVSPDLMYVDLPIRSKKECHKLLKHVTDLHPGMMCAGYLEGERDACQGDSGGGMICNGILTGVVSGGSGCAQPMLPGIYSNISYYLDWILTDMDAVVVVQSFNTGNCGVFNTSMIMVIISFLFFGVINYT